MTEDTSNVKKPFSADWLFRGVLTRLGDTFDRFTGRRWIPSSSLATSELIERLKKLIDAEAREVPGKGRVVPHMIRLKMQWDKFSEDTDSSLQVLKTELLTAAIDHINNSLYYTLAPVTLDVKTDYFTEGVKLSVSFDKFEEAGPEVEMNVTLPSVNLGDLASPVVPALTPGRGSLVARFTLGGRTREVNLTFPDGGRIQVGRTGENALILDDVSVSKMHAVIVLSENVLAVADTGSTNGTFINGVRIAYGKAVQFAMADRISFGTVEVRFELFAPEQEQDLGESATETDEGVEIGGFRFKSKTAGPESEARHLIVDPIGDANENAGPERADAQEEERKVSDGSDTEA